MEDARQTLVARAPAVDDDSHISADSLTAKQEAFARAWAETGNQAAAYRRSYTVTERTLPNTIWAAASRLAAKPAVRARYKVLMEQSVLESIMSIREFLQWQIDVATADPNEIVRVVARCCRNCYGTAYRHQWRDQDEYTDACVLALDNKQNPPTDEGGYGFNGALEPLPTCPHCYGVGIEQTIISDTTKLTGKARKLYKGAKQDRHGAIEILLHDQQKAAEMAGRILGAFNDKLDLRTPEERAKSEARTKLPENVTADGAAKAYLTLIN